MSENLEKYTDADIEKLYKSRIAEYKKAIPDLKIEHRYWQLISEISEFKHKVFTIKQMTANHGNPSSQQEKADTNTSDDNQDSANSKVSD